MKRISILVLLAAVTVSVQAQTKFFEGTWKDAFAEAQKQNKYLFIDCYTDWCGWCKVADKKTFPDENVAKLLNKHFVSVKVDMERGEGVPLAMKYRVTGFPSYLVFTADGSFAHKMTGYFEDPNDFIAEVKVAMDESKRFAYPSKLTDKVEFPWFYVNAFTNKDSKEKRKNPDPTDVNDWLKKQTNWLTEEAWSVIYRFPLTEENSAKFLDSRKELSKMFGKTEVVDKTRGIASQLLEEAMGSQLESDLQEALDFVDKYIDEDKKVTKVYYRMRFSEATGDWAGYAKGAQDMIDIYGLEKHLGGINNYSWTIYLNVDDEKILNAAIGWMEKVVALDPLYMYLDTYAALFFKAGEYDKAISWADKAIEVGTKAEENVQDTEELRDQIIAAKEGK